MPFNNFKFCDVSSFSLALIFIVCGCFFFDSLASIILLLIYFSIIKLLISFLFKFVKHKLFIYNLFVDLVKSFLFKFDIFDGSNKLNKLSSDLLHFDNCNL